jgi:transcriptional regulator with XRE-family HTH domain
MKTSALRAERRRLGWGQVEAASRLGVSQAYLAMLETGKRRLTPALERKVVAAYGLPPAELPLPAAFTPPEKVDAQRLMEDLAKLNYPGFAYVQTRARSKHPGEVLLTALAQERLEARAAEALPWLLLRYWQMDLRWLVGEAKRFDLQNRLGFVVNLARQVSERSAETERTQSLARLESSLEPSRLAREDYFYRPPRNDHERQWLLANRPDAAGHWNLLSDLRPEHLQYATWQKN